MKLTTLTSLIVTVSTTGTALATQDNPLTTTTNDVLLARFSTIYGPSGLINIPSAYGVTLGRSVLGTTIARDRGVSVNYGLFPNLEVGGAYYEQNGRTDGKVFGNAKYTFSPSNVRGIQFGAGIIDAADTIDQTVYVVASADIITPNALGDTFIGTRVHLGYGNGLFQKRVIGGVELLFTPKFSVIGEYDGLDGNFAARYVLNDSVRAQAGIRNKSFFFALSTAFNL